MRTWTVLLLVVFGLLGIFVMLNLNAVLAPTSLSLGVTQIQAPLGVILLGALAVLSALFLGFAVTVQGGALLEARRFARELEAQRTLADRAEESRFVDLQARLAQTERALHQHIDQLQPGLGGAVVRPDPVPPPRELPPG